MVGQINYSILDQNAPLKAAQSWDLSGAYNEGINNSLAQQQARQTQQVNALALQKAQREMSDDESVRNALSGSGGDWEAASKAMMEGGQYKQALELKTKIQEQKTKQIQQQVESLKLVKSAADFVFANPAPENAVATLHQLAQQTGQDFSGEIAAVQNMGPEQIRKWAAGHSLTAKEMMLKTEKMDLGGTSNLMSVDPVTGKVVGQQAFNKTMSPGEIAADTRARTGLDQGKIPAGYRRSADGNLEAIPGGPGDKKTQGRPLPTAALKLQQEELDAIGTASTIASDLGEIKRQVDTKELQLGPGKNLANSALNMAGMSTKGSQKFASFKATLEKLRNDSLRLNKGVQTEGDAVRAWNEILTNINDQDLVSNRLEEVIKINERAKNLRTMNVDTIRANYGHDPLDLSGYNNLPTALGKTKPGGAMPPQPGTMKDGYRFNGGNPADPASWVKVP